MHGADLPMEQTLLLSVNVLTTPLAMCNLCFTWAKAVPCVADSVLLLMLYFRTLLDQNTSELFITVNDDYQQQLTTTNY